MKEEEKNFSVARYQHAIYSLNSTPEESKIKERMKDTDRSTKMKETEYSKLVITISRLFVQWAFFPFILAYFSRLT